MNLLEAIQKRRSTRAFKPTPIDQELLDTIFTQAQFAPSNCNTQPWHVSVVSGKMRDELEKRMIADIMGGKAPNMSFKPGDQGLKDEFRKRQIDCAIALYDSERSGGRRRYMRVLMNSRRRILKHGCGHTHTHTDTDTSARAHTHRHTQPHTGAHIPQTHSHTDVCAHTQTPAHVCANTVVPHPCAYPTCLHYLARTHTCTG